MLLLVIDKIICYWWKIAKSLRGRSLAIVYFFSIRQVYFIYSIIKLFCKLLHLYGLRINIWALLPERRKHLEIKYLLLPIPKKESKQMTAKVIFCVFTYKITDLLRVQ